MGALRDPLVDPLLVLLDVGGRELLDRAELRRLVGRRVGRQEAGQLVTRRAELLALRRIAFEGVGIRVAGLHGQPRAHARNQLAQLTDASRLGARAGLRGALDEADGGDRRDAGDGCGQQCGHRGPEANPHERTLRAVPLTRDIKLLSIGT